MTQRESCPYCNDEGRVLKPYLGWQVCRCRRLGRDPAAAALEPPGVADCAEWEGKA